MFSLQSHWKRRALSPHISVAGKQMFDSLAAQILKWWIKLVVEWGFFWWLSFGLNLMGLILCCETTTFIALLRKVPFEFPEVNCVSGCLSLAPGSWVLIEHINLSFESGVSYTTTGRKEFKEVEMTFKDYKQRITSFGSSSVSTVLCIIHNAPNTDRRGCRRKTHCLQSTDIADGSLRLICWVTHPPVEMHTRNSSN